ncbi:MAG TPA: hypothetical protein VHL81_10075 [Gemmatimonadales bacterium]|nr:hypothetical protein [Gemmatimonadales bacterium]
MRRPPLRRLAAVVLANGLLLLFTRLLAAQQPSAADTSASEVLLQLRIDGGPVEVISALGRDTTILLPVRRLLELAEVRTGTILPGHRLSGVLEPGRVSFGFDTDSGTVARGDSSWHVSRATLTWSGGELYATTDALGAALDITFQSDPGELILVASHTADLPVVRRLAREQRRRMLLGLPNSTPWEVALSRPRRMADGAVLDWAYTGSLTDPVDASLVQLGLGAQLLGGSLELQYLGQQSPTGGTTDFRSSWSGAWPTNRWVRQFRVGDIVPGARRGRTVRGFELTNAPFLRPAAFGQELLEGTVPDGWEVDLYQDQQLLSSSPSTGAGRYALDVPLRYGSNAVEVLAYGPNGEVIHRRRAVQVPFDRLPAGRFEYAASAGACEDEPCAGALSLSARYGISRWLTAEAGSDNFWRDSLPDLWHPYALVSAAATTSTGLTLEAVAHGLLRGRVDFDPTPDFHLDLEHTRFATGIVAPLVTPGSERSRTDVVAFWRPRPLVGNSYLQLALSHAALPVGSSDAERLALTTRFSALRLVTGLHHQHTVAAEDADEIGVDAAGDLVLRGPGAVFRSLYVRGELSLETSGLSRIAASVGRQIAGPVRLDVGTGWSRGQRGPALDVALSTNLPSLRAASRSRWTAESGLEGTNLLEGSATYDRHLGRFEFGNGRLIGRARVVGRVFRDLNGNGHHEPDEPGLAGVRLRVGSRGVTTDSLGRYSAWDLVPFEATSVEVDTLSLEDPLWVPAALVYRLVPGPNSYDAVDVPMLPASEAAGRVVLGDDAGVGGVSVLLRHLGSGATTRVTTFSDGAFYAAGLRPGEYEVSVPNEVLDLLKAAQTPVRFRVEPSPEGGVLDGVVLRLERHPDATR